MQSCALLSQSGRGHVNGLWRESGVFDVGACRRGLEDQFLGDVVEFNSAVVGRFFIPKFPAQVAINLADRLVDIFYFHDHGYFCHFRIFGRI
jgi:hypothetical protein